MTIDTSTTPPGAAASPAEQVDALVAAMTLEEKVAQLYGVWVGAGDDGGDVAPHQHDMEEVVDLDAILPNGLGQLTRPFGTAPVDPALGALSLLRAQERIVAAGRHGIQAVAHEECLAGFAAWGATAYPVPLSWGATFDPELVERMAGQIGADMRSVGVHQGLAPVLDVVRDARWGRVEETIGEDPYLVGSLGSAYVRGIESAGIVSTLKHFVGYSASRAGRNLAPVSIGPRERADVLLPPFEMALREGGARSVMNAYTDADGVPSAGDAELLTGLLRDTWGFTGTVVADYFAVAFLRMLHGVAEGWGDAAALALTAGIDVELPTVNTFGAPLLEAVGDGRLAEDVIDRALRRVLAQKLELGLLGPGGVPVPPALEGRNLDDAESLRGTVDLDPPQNRRLAREVSDEAVVLVRNDGTLPLAAPRRIAIIGPNADDPLAVLGCYSFPSHIGVRHPDVPHGIALPTMLESMRAEFPAAEVDYVLGTTIDGGETDGFADAVAAAGRADVAVLVLGDRSGLFGRGTSGEGCDVESLALPGAQQGLLDAVLASGTPTIVTLLSGRPYALGTAPQDAAAIVQTFFPGEEGTTSIAGVLSGRVNPSGRLPVSIPRSPGSQPATYLTAALGAVSGVSNIDPTAAYPFGAGIGYTTFDWEPEATDATTAGTAGEVEAALRVRNTGTRAGVEVVQLYLHDPVASVVRPVQRLIGFVRVPLEPGESARISVRVPADLASFTGRAGQRIVEPGELVLGFGRSSADIPVAQSVTLTGTVRFVDHTRALHPTFDVVRGE
ncbi:MAG: glycoside hydrolase family 3 N-terminal domain-containing protein [Pseudolysinimonas sp.]